MKRSLHRELVVLCHLRQNARKTLTSMSKQTKIPITTLHEVLKSKKSWKYTVLTDFANFGFRTKALLFLKVKKEQKQDLREYLRTHYHVNSLHRINNGFDLLCEVVFHHLRDLEDFVEYLEDKFSIKQKEVHHLMDEIKREGFLTDPHFLPLIGK